MTEPDERRLGNWPSKARQGMGMTAPRRGYLARAGMRSGREVEMVGSGHEVALAVDFHLDPKLSTECLGILPEGLNPGGFDVAAFHG